MTIADGSAPTCDPLLDKQPLVAKRLGQRRFYFPAVALFRLSLSFDHADLLGAQIIKPIHQLVNRRVL